MENAELYLKMKEMARIDGLTGIYNRQYFQERLQSEFKRRRRMVIRCRSSYMTSTISRNSTTCTGTFSETRC